MADCIEALQKSIGLKIPQSADEWADAPHNLLYIRHDHVIQDGLRAARKARFDANGIMEVKSQLVLSYILQSVLVNVK